MLQFLKMSAEPRALHWCFTHNNYTAEDVERLKSLGDQVRYMVFGREVGQSGTPHLQGFVSLLQRKRLRQLQAFLGIDAHFEVARDVAASAEYCKKDGAYDEIGTPPAGAGSRSDIDEFKEAVKAGLYNMREIYEKHSELCARSPTFVQKYVAFNAPVPALAEHPLRPWQETLNHKLNLDPDPREIIFCVDFRGNTGKSWFAHHYTRLHPTNTQVLVPGKKADMIYAMEHGLRCVFLDCPRSKQGDIIQYDFLEEIKNGYLFSPKYHSEIKRLGPCHVVVMMNEHPDMTKLSQDRYYLHDMGTNTVNRTNMND